DYILDDILQKLPMADNVQQGKAFLFDGQGIVFGSQQNKLTEMTAMNTLYAGVKPANQLLQRYAAAVAAQNGTAKAVTDIVPDYLISSAHVNRLNWYVAVYAEKSRVLTTLDEFRSKLLVTFLLVALLVSLLLQLVIYQFILKRLNRLSAAINRLSRGDLQHVMLDNKQDEIGMLNQAFGRMSAEISDLVSGLNERIEEKEAAERSARK